MFGVHGCRTCCQLSEKGPIGPPVLSRDPFNALSSGVHLAHFSHMPACTLPIHFLFYLAFWQMSVQMDSPTWFHHLGYFRRPLNPQPCNFDLNYRKIKNLSLFLALTLCRWRVFPREWLTSIPLVWPYCIPVLLLPLERDSELLRERESVLRLRERRWLDGASFDTERGSTSREGEPSLDKKSIPVQSPVSLGEELQWWPDKVGEQTATGIFRPLDDLHPSPFLLPWFISTCLENVFQVGPCHVFLTVHVICRFILSHFLSLF